MARYVEVAAILPPFILPSEIPQFRPRYMQIGTDFVYHQNSCGRCGKSHGFQDCPALRRVCYKCRRYGHYAQLCRAARQKTTVHTVNVTEPETAASNNEAPVPESNSPASHYERPKSTSKQTPEVSDIYAKIRTERDNLIQENSKLQLEVSKLTDAIQELKDKNENIEDNLSKLHEYYVGIQDVIECKNMLLQQSYLEFQHILERLKQDGAPNQCGKCGIKHGPTGYCQADSWKCIKCWGYAHFSTRCPTPLYRSPVEDYHQELLDKLNQSTKDTWPKETIKSNIYQRTFNIYNETRR